MTTKNLGDCPHGIPSNLHCGACAAETPNAMDQTLAERGARYGDFRDHARISQNIQRAMADSPNWATLDDVKREGLIIIAHKIARALNGDPEYRDNWHDIAGYSKLVEDRCAVEPTPTNETIYGDNAQPMAVSEDVQKLYEALKAAAEDDRKRVAAEADMAQEHNEILDDLTWKTVEDGPKRITPETEPVPPAAKPVYEPGVWYDWAGGECPVDPQTRVLYAMRCWPNAPGHVPEIAHRLDWGELGEATIARFKILS